MKKIVPLAAVLALLISIAACSKPFTREGTEENLRRLVTACQQYSADHPPENFYPQIDLTLGRLTMAADSAYLDLIENGDDTYIYLGYAVCTGQNADLYLDMYRDFAEGRFVPDKDYVRPGTGQTLMRLKTSVEIYCSANMIDPNANAKAPATMPLILERRDRYEDKRAPVAFFDGHIEWLAPGQNEVVDRIHELLPQLDAFGG